MNKRTVLASLNKIANELDNNGLHNEADTVTKVMSRLAYDDFDERDYDNDKMDGMDLMGDDYLPYGDPDGDPDEYMEDEDYDMEDDMPNAKYDFEGMGKQEINGNDEYNIDDYFPYGEADGSDYDGDDF
jgi:hypothetical protein